MRAAALLLIALLSAALTQAASAHEVRPAYLELTETAEAEFEGVWKQPILDGRRLKISPVFPEDCAREDTGYAYISGAVVERFRLSCPLSEGEISITLLDRTLTDVFVRIERLGGDTETALLKPGSATLDLTAPSAAAVRAYIRIGVEHIIFGWDHLLFVTGMVLLVARRQLIATITAFTVAHSITLALSVLAGVTLPGPPVEIVIALSLSLLAAEALHRLNGRTTLGQRLPWVIAFGFGLIHGFGFAGAISELGLPEDARALALLLFNVGVELGQLMIVALLIALAALVKQIGDTALPVAQRVAAYGVGVAGMAWTFERAAAAWIV